MDGTPAHDVIPTTGRAADHSPRTARSTAAAGFALLVITLALLAAGAGCQDQTSLIPNTDPALRKSKTEFARDALQRQPYHADAPKAGKIAGGATVDYGMDTIQVANFTPADWKDVEVWVNGRWVVYLPKVPGNAETAKTIDFTMLYDEYGRPFPSDNQSPEAMVKKVEVYHDGRMYELAGLTAE